MEVKVPKGYIVCPNGDEKLAGVIPDHIVRNHLPDEEDEVLRYTLEKLIKPLRTSDVRKRSVNMLVLAYSSNCYSC